MKNLAKLTLFFSFVFVVLFLAAVLLRLLFSWIDLARIIPLGVMPVEDVTEAAWKALPIVLYLSILLALSYSARRNIPIPLAILCLLTLGCAFSAGFSLGIKHTEAINPILKPIRPVRAGPGLILSRSDMVTVLLRESSEIRGPRVVSFPDQPLIYQSVPLGPNNTILDLPALSFGDDTPWFIHSMGIDFSLCAAEIKGRLEDNYLSYAVYAFSLILLLVSLRFLLELSQWPLANLFLGALVFRGVLALEVFLNAREINALIGAFFGGRVPPVLITPLAFSALGVLIILYTLLTRIARQRKQYDDD